MTLKIGIDVGGTCFDTPLDMFWYAVDNCPDRLALSAGENNLDYGAYAAAVISLAGQIRTYGYKRPKVAILLPNGVEFCCAVFAGWQAGAIISLHNILQPEKALEDQFLLVEPDLIVAAPDQEEVIKNIVSKTKYILVDEGCFNGNGSQVPCRPDWPVASGDDLSLLLFTGGTTGVSKAVEHSFATISASIRGMEYAWPTETGKEIWLSVSPMFHVYGFLFCVMNSVFSIATNIMGYPFRTESCIKIMKKHHVTVFSGGPPAVYSALLSNQDFNRQAFGNLKICGGGGAAFTGDMLDRWYKVTAVQITEAYGMTEIAPITANSMERGNKPGSVGRAGPGLEIHILDTDGGEIMPTGATGRIFIRSPQIMTGYYKNSEETRAVLKDDWLETGDIGHLDEDGYLFLTGRTKEMINVSGFKVYPREVDDILGLHPAILECCTLGMADSRTGEAVISCVVLQKGERLSEEQIQQYVRQKLSSYKCPKQIYFMDQIPQTAARKQDRKALQELLICNECDNQ